MTTREKFKKAIVMGCHPECKTYEEALNKEDAVLEDGKIYPNPYGLSIGRVMQALELGLNNNSGAIRVATSGEFYMAIKGIKMNIRWQLTKDGIECVDDDQSDECIKALLKLLQPF